MNNDNAMPNPPALTPSIRTVGVNRSVEWITGGFRMFMKVPASWVMITIGLIIAGGLLGYLLPARLGDLVSDILGIVIIGVLMKVCHAQDEGRDPAGSVHAKASSAPLWILGLIAAALSYAVALLTGLLGLSTMAVMMMNPAAIFETLGFGAVFVILINAAVFMALWLAPALIVLKGVNPIEAMKLSLLGSLKNIVAYIVYGILVVLLCIVGAIPLLLGLLVVIPMIVCGTYLAYKDIFGK